MEIEIIGGAIIIRQHNAELTGSEKQVVWADEIRHTIFKGFIAMIEGAAKRSGKSITEMLDLPQNGTTMRAVFEALSSKADAKFWIDNRGLNQMAIIKMIHAEITA